MARAHSKQRELDPSPAASIPVDDDWDLLLAMDEADYDLELMLFSPPPAAVCPIRARRKRSARPRARISRFVARAA
jgi:hypothetical protein